MPNSVSSLAANASRFRGSPELYERYRPAPPPFFREVVQQFARVTRPEVVVDLGCGTGLSTHFWVGYAGRVVGLDPNEDMLAFAARAPGAPDVTFRHGYSHATGLEGGSVDLVTCCQSIHWMDPVQTIAEVTRILRPGGLLAVLSYDFPPLLDWELDLAVQECLRHAQEICVARGLQREEKRWASGHAAQIEESGCFRRVRQIAFHGEDSGGAARLIGCMRTLGDVAKALQDGATKTEVGLDDLERIARRLLGEDATPWTWSYEAILAVK